MIKKLLSFVSLLTLLIQLNAFAYTETKTYFYRYEPTYILTKDGVDSFIDTIKKDSRSVYIFPTLLWDVKDCAPRNKINFPNTLLKINNTLNDKIQRIISLEGKSIGIDDIITGLGLIGISCVGIYGIFRLYQKFFVKKRRKMYSLVEKLAHRNVHISHVSGYRAILTDETVSLTLHDQETIAQVITLHNQAELSGCFLILGAMIPIAGVIQGFINCWNGLDPHYDDQYLPAYKSLLATLKQYL